MFTQYDIEYLILFAALGILFCAGLKPSAKKGMFHPFVIDQTMSQALKGIACVLILMGHWGQRKFDVDMPWGVSKVVWQTTATTALVWFMFFSGYGMSLKRIMLGEHLGKWWKSMKKIFLPCVLTCAAFLLLCAILPDCYTSDEVKNLWLPQEINMLHHLDMATGLALLPSLLGGGDWYVYCILMFYTIFYVTSYIAEKFDCNQTLLLGLAFVIYWLWAYWYFGPEQGHYYRFVWTFMFGHAVAKRTKLSWAILLFLAIPVLTEGKMTILDFSIAVVVLYALSYINSRYEMSGKYILWLGTISYFFYLVHIRIGYTLLTYTGIDSILLWVAITTIISFVLHKLYSQLSSYDNIKKRTKILSQG